MILVGTCALLLLIGGYAVIAHAAPSTEAWPNPSQPDAPGSVTALWTSGWTAINPGQTLTFHHNLGGNPDNYAVDLWFLDTEPGGLGIHRANYGSLEYSGNWFGAHWENLTNMYVQVYRQPQDLRADMIRIMVWTVPTAPDYDSGWTAINKAQTRTFNHNLGGTNTDLVVGLYFISALRGIHQHRFGGVHTQAPPNMYGAYWHNLTNASVQVTREGNDVDVEQVRVVVSRSDPPAYDSLVALGGWRNVEAGSTYGFAHNLNWNPDMLLVRGECNDTHLGGLGIHARYAGGNHDVGGHWQGMHLQNLTANAVTAARRQDDTVCPQSRVIIYKRSIPLYLPLMQNNAVSSTELGYDDGTADSWQTQATLNSGFAVRFTTPGASARLVQARYRLNTAAGGHPIQVHVWNTAHGDLITPFTATPPAGIGWFNVDLSAYNLTVSGDFYVGFLYSAQHSDPSIGVDTASPNGRSYEVPWQA